MSASVVLAWVLRHEVLLGWAAALCGALVLMTGLYACGRHAGVAAERPRVEAARQAAAVAVAQGAVVTTAAAAADAAGARSAHVLAKAEEAAHAVQSAPGADAPLDPDLLSRWRSGLVGLRAEAPGADRAGGGEPAQPLPAPQR